jgi:hypothetical protein
MEPIAILKPACRALEAYHPPARRYRHGDSRPCPGNAEIERRIAEYQRRAARQLPLFGEQAA